jgi:hypothetical protein
MPIDLDKLEGLEPAGDRTAGKIDEDELLEMLGEAAYSAKEVKEHFGSAHGTANTRLTNLFKAKIAGRVQDGNTFYYSLWDNFSAEQQGQFEIQIAELEAKEAEKKAAKKEE